VGEGAGGGAPGPHSRRSLPLLGPGAGGDDRVLARGRARRRRPPSRPLLSSPAPFPKPNGFSPSPRDSLASSYFPPDTTKTAGSKHSSPQPLELSRTVLPTQSLRFLCTVTASFSGRLECRFLPVLSSSENLALEGGGTAFTVAAPGPRWSTPDIRERRRPLPPALPARRLPLEVPGKPLDSRSYFREGSCHLSPGSLPAAGPRSKSKRPPRPHRPRDPPGSLVAALSLLLSRPAPGPRAAPPPGRGPLLPATAPSPRPPSAARQTGDRTPAGRRPPATREGPHRAPNPVTTRKEGFGTVGSEGTTISSSLRFVLAAVCLHVLPRWLHPRWPPAPGAPRRTSSVIRHLPSAACTPSLTGPGPSPWPPPGHHSAWAQLPGPAVAPPRPP